MPTIPPENRIAVLRSLNEQEQVQSVRLLGGGECPSSQASGAVTVKLPEQLPATYVNCLAMGMAAD
jgi:hypothetical protein